jgi:hypothetical protein
VILSRIRRRAIFIDPLAKLSAGITSRFADDVPTLTGSGEKPRRACVGFLHLITLFPLKVTEGDAAKAFRDLVFEFHAVLDPARFDRAAQGEYHPILSIPSSAHLMAACTQAPSLETKFGRAYRNQNRGEYFLTAAAFIDGSGARNRIAM